MLPVGPSSCRLYDWVLAPKAITPQSRSRRPVRKAQNGSTDEIFCRSLGLCTSTICGPNEIICMPGCFSPITPHSSPACMATSSGVLPSISKCTACAFAHDVAGRLGLPTWVATGMLHFKACQPEYGGHHATGRQLAAFDGAAVAGLPSCRDFSSSPAVPSLPGSSSRHRRRCRWGIPRTCRLGEPPRGMHAWDHRLARPGSRTACATSRTSIAL